MMKKTLHVTGMLLLAAVLAGCGGQSADAEIASEVLSTEAKQPTETIAVTLVNSTNVYVREVIFSVPEDETYEGYGALQQLDGLEPGEDYTAEIPVANSVYQIEAYDTEWKEMYDGALQGDVQDGSVIVLLPEDTGTQMIYEPGTDVEEAKQEASLAYSAEIAARQEEAEQREEASDNQELADEDSMQQAAKKLGYESVEDMRFMTHEGFNRDDAEFWQLTGYWYPDGDTNSRTYFAVDNRDNIRWYSFDETQGDVETEVDGITKKVLSTYTLHSGKQFTVKDDVILFDGDDTLYHRGTF